MSEDLIKAEPRTEFGKGAARRIRRADKIPAVIYGHGTEPIHLTLPGHDTMMAIRHGGTNTVLSIEIDGTTQLALTKQVQSDPIKGFIKHVDLVSVKKGEKVHVDVAVHVVGEAVSDALVVIETNTVAIEAEATHIPEAVEVSVAGATVGTQITAGELSLPAGSTLLGDADQLIVNITHAPTADEVTAELDSAEAEAGVQHDAPQTEEPASEDAPAEGDEA